MNDSIHLWLAAQREVTERWLAASSQDAAFEQAQKFWQTIAESVSPSARDFAQQLMQLGPHVLAGAGDALFDLFGAPSPQRSGDAWFGRWLELAPIGYFREHQAHAQELARSLEEYRRVTVQMTTAIARIHADALELLAKQAEELAAAGQPITDTQRLYSLWIECGERAFAQHARDDAFGRLQGELVNAGVRVRVAQQTIAEYFLKSLDLPTRAELNSVHKRLKEMRERIERLESGPAVERDSAEAHR